MRAVFGLVGMVVVLAVVLLLVKQQTQLIAPVQPAGGAASGAVSGPAQPLPQAVGKQVEGLLQQGAERASEAMP